MKSESAGDGATEHFDPIDSWEDLDIHPGVLRSIYATGFERPSPIQSKAILPMLAGRDTIAQAQSGTGKTGCFAIGCLGKIDVSVRKTQALILAPTRELAAQIQSVVQSLARQLEGLTTLLLVGGTSTEQNLSDLGQRPHIVVGCPGRVHDMLRRRKLPAADVRMVVLDEADEMLSQGFKEQVYMIFQFLPQDVQVSLFSATLPPEVTQLTSRFMRDPVKVLVKAEMLTLEGIEQYYVALDADEQKYATLKDLFGILSLSQAIIYCNSVRRVSDLHDAMREDDFPVSQIHSGMGREERETAFKDFKEGKTRVLISSNVTARGIDVQQVSTVINFDVPRCVHTYLHRIGRSGRWGRKGRAINFVTRRDGRKMEEIEQHYGTTVKELPADVVALASE